LEREPCLKERNYNVYQFCIRDALEYVGKVVGKTILVAFLFFNSYKAMIMIVPLGVMEYASFKREKIAWQKKQLTIQFQSLIEIVSNALGAGYSLESAFVEAEKDLRLVYTKEESIFYELHNIKSGLSMNVPIERLLKKFAIRTGIQDIEDFANVVVVAKKSGGNLIHIIQKTVQRITERMTVEEEIQTLIAAKKLEQKIMMIMPYGIIFYLRFTNEGFFDVLYGNIVGVCIMLVFFFVIQFADWWARKIMEIQV